MKVFCSHSILGSVVLFVLLASALPAQVLTVVDDATGQPVILAKLVCEAPQASVLTNAHGQANIKILEGADKILISADGYSSRILSFTELRDKDFFLPLESANISLDQVVVSANRWDQNSRNVPARITSLKPRDVQLHNPATTADLLGVSGEVFIQKSQLGGGSPMIRGFSTNRLLYAVDGVRMNNAIFRSGNMQNIISLDAFALESSEVLFGPGSVMYGSDAIGAVMSFQTLTPQLSLSGNPEVSGKAVTRYASASQERTAHFDLNIGWKKWASLTSFTATRFGDLRMGRYGPDDYLRHNYVQRIDDTDRVLKNPDPLVQRPTGYDQMNLMQKLRFKPNANWDFQYALHYSATSDFPRYDRLIQTRNGLPQNGRWDYGPQVWVLNQLSVTHQHGNALYDQLQLRLAYQYFEESRITRGFNDPLETTQLEMVDAYSANADFVKSWGKAQLFYGLEAVQNHVLSRGRQEHIEQNFIERAGSRYPNATWESYAAYVTYQQKLGQRLTLQSGLRYNGYGLSADFGNNQEFYPLPFRETEMRESAFNGSLGLVYNPSESWTVRANASTGFRAPNVDDLAKFFDSEPGRVVVPNPDLSAEYAYNYELGAARVIGRVLKLEMTGYFTQLNNAMVRRNFQLNGQDSILYLGEPARVQAIQNAEEAMVYGIQASAELKLPGGFGFSSRYNWQRGTESIEGETTPSRHAAPAFGTARLNYRYKRLQLQFYADYSEERSHDEMPVGEANKPHLYAADENGNAYSPGWYTLNIKALYKLNDTFSVTAGVENLTDQRYRTYSSGITAPGRNLQMSVQATF